jgi:hypothetical protein
MRQTEKAFLGRLMKAVGLRQFNFTGKAPAVCIRGEGEEFFYPAFADCAAPFRFIFSH